MPSSVIHGMLYLPEHQTLIIVFRGERGSYRYFEVERAEWVAFRRAPSKGTYLNHVFKARHLRFEHLVDATEGWAHSLTASEAPGPRDLPDENVWGFYETSL